MNAFQDQAMIYVWQLVGVVAMVAAAIDIWRFRIPNALTFPLCGAGLVFHTAMSGLAGLQYSAAGLGVGFGILIAFFVLGVMGAGDVKLLAAIGAWLGPTDIFYVFIVAALASGVHTVILFALQGRMKELSAICQIWVLQAGMLGKHIVAPETVQVAANQTDRRRKVMPFALMIAIGVMVVAARSLGIEFQSAS